MRDWLMLFVAVGLGMIVVLVATTVKPEAFTAYKTGFEEGFEEGKLYVRNCMLQQADSILGCSRIGYIPDTISVKPELKNNGSYKLR
jgi:hypothetical protein